MRARQVMFWLAAAAVVGGLSAGVAIAGKPPAGGGGTGGGTIYFQHSGSFWKMNSDGSGKTQLAAGGEPSHQLHGGQRWFLVFAEVGGTHPDGSAVWEIVAVGEDAQVTVQLTSDANLKFEGFPRWGKDDSFFSASCVDWSGGSPVSRLVQVALTFDGSGGSVAAGTPAAVLTNSQVQTGGNGEVFSTILNHDWSPDAGKVVWTDRSSGSVVLRVTTVAGGATTTLAAGGWPAWSNDGATIAYNGPNGVESITPAGANHKTLVRNGKSGSYGRPDWSPTDSHVVYWRSGSTFPYTSDVGRVTSGGSDKTELTTDVSAPAIPFGWR